MEAQNEPDEYGHHRRRGRLQLTGYSTSMMANELALAPIVLGASEAKKSGSDPLWNRLDRHPSLSEPEQAAMQQVCALEPH